MSRRLYSTSTIFGLIALMILSFCTTVYAASDAICVEVHRISPTTPCDASTPSSAVDATLLGLKAGQVTPTEAIQKLGTYVCGGYTLGYDASADPAKLKDTNVYFDAGNASVDPNFAVCTAKFLDAAKTAGLQPCITAALRTVPHQAASCRDMHNSVVCGRQNGCTSFSMCPHVLGIGIDIKSQDNRLEELNKLAASFGLRMGVPTKSGGVTDLVHTQPVNKDCSTTGFSNPTQGNAAVSPAQTMVKTLVSGLQGLLGQNQPSSPTSDTPLSSSQTAPIQSVFDSSAVPSAPTTPAQPASVSTSVPVPDTSGPTASGVPSYLPGQTIQNTAYPVPVRATSSTSTILNIPALEGQPIANPYAAAAQQVSVTHASGSIQTSNNSAGIAVSTMQADNSGTGGFFADTATSAPPLTILQNLCIQRPWANTFLSYIVSPDYFDSLCIRGGYVEEGVE